MNFPIILKELKKKNIFTSYQLTQLNNIVKDIELIKELNIDNSILLNNSIKMIENQINRIKNISIIQEISSKLQNKNLSFQLISIILSKLDNIQNGYQEFLKSINSLDQNSKVFSYPQQLKEFFKQISQLRIVKDNSSFSTGSGQIVLCILLSNAKLKIENSIDYGDLVINNKLYDVKSINSNSAIIKADSQDDNSYLKKQLDYIIFKSKEEKFLFKFLKKEEIGQYLHGFRKATLNYSGGKKIKINL